jgi:hypothetical protein
VLAVSLLGVASPAGAMPPEVVHENGVFLTSGAARDVCGNAAFFEVSGTVSTTIVDFGDGVSRIQISQRGTYTVTFFDSSLGVWEGTFHQTASVGVTPGGTYTNVATVNNQEGPVRIHRLVQFVQGPDGTIRVVDFKDDIVGCPSG